MWIFVPFYLVLCQRWGEGWKLLPAVGRSFASPTFSSPVLFFTSVWHFGPNHSWGEMALAEYSSEAEAFPQTLPWPSSSRGESTCMRDTCCPLVLQSQEEVRIKSPSQAVLSLEDGPKSGLCLEFQCSAIPESLAVDAVRFLYGTTPTTPLAADKLISLVKPAGGLHRAGLPPSPGSWRDV